MPQHCGGTSSSKLGHQYARYYYSRHGPDDLYSSTYEVDLGVGLGIKSHDTKMQSKEANSQELFLSVSQPPPCPHPTPPHPRAAVEYYCCAVGIFTRSMQAWSCKDKVILGSIKVVQGAES